MTKQGIILLSGGLDSAVTAAIARDRGFTLTALTFSYGQRHSVELGAAENLARFFGINDHVKVGINPEIFSSSLMEGSADQVPKGTGPGEGIPTTYVPARNIIFLSYGLALAESRGAERVFIGANAVDYSGYPDCRPEFFTTFNAMAGAGTKRGVEGNPVTVEAPVVTMKKSGIIRTGASLGVDFSLTHSCYDPGPGGSACGACDSCRIRRRGFEEAGVNDPTRYREG